MVGYVFKLSLKVVGHFYKLSLKVVGHAFKLGSDASLTSVGLLD